MRSVWTTNFDGLVPRASAAANLICIEIGGDTPHRVERPQAEGELRVISMHGDYRYDDLKNTVAELQQQEEGLRAELLHELQDYDLVVIGYSGRDASLTVAMDDGALAFANGADVQKGFGPALRGSPIAAAISEDDIVKDGRIRSLFRRALVQSVASRIGAMTDGSRRLWAAAHYKDHSLQNTTYRLHRALSFRLESVIGKPHVALMPEVVATTLDGVLVDADISKLIRNAVYGYQHNDVFDSDLKYWTREIVDLDAPAKGGGVFRIGRAPIYAGLFQKSRAALPQEMQRHARQPGLIVSDADLLFSSSNGKIEVRNPNPLKGLVENRPWDFQLTTSGLSASMEMAAICPAQDAAKLMRFLNQLQDRTRTRFTIKVRLCRADPCVINDKASRYAAKINARSSLAVRTLPGNRKRKCPE